ncbi:hypothetical protein TNCV_412191 [Trichonephila clavipes]|uniref:Uncharacterized protein n=1 Tax=Trichonephila clavipes TaxID=2585209 RepID=A0A8X6VBH7_TRICX|nr:hypothetical protein TNCV_412191 [Trichonephila clavipes]
MCQGPNEWMAVKNRRVPSKDQCEGMSSEESICLWHPRRKRNGEIKAVQELVQHLFHPLALKISTGVAHSHLTR